MIQGIVNRFAEWAWANNLDPSVISPEICLQNTIPSAPCLTTVLSKGIGLVIIAGSFLNKAPLVYNILRNQSVAGISIASIYTEMFMYSSTALYSILKQNPFTSWGENAVLAVQTLLVAFLMWHYYIPKIGYIHRLVAATTFALYTAFVLYILTPQYYYLLPSVNLPLTIYARGCQVYTFYSCRHTGSMSFITNSMNFVGASIRVLTTINEVGWDIPLVSSYGMSVILNGILLTQFWLYRKGTEVYTRQLRDKKNKQE